MTNFEKYKHELTNKWCRFNRYDVSCVCTRDQRLCEEYRDGYDDIILPCPICGMQPILYFSDCNNIKGYVVMCPKELGGCGHSSSGQFTISLEEAIQTWNRLVREVRKQ